MEDDVLHVISDPCADPGEDPANFAIGTAQVRSRTHPSLQRIEYGIEGLPESFSIELHLIRGVTRLSFPGGGVLRGDRKKSYEDVAALLWFLADPIADV